MPMVGSSARATGSVVGKNTCVFAIPSLYVHRPEVQRVSSSSSALLCARRTADLNTTELHRQSARTEL